jgi:hypothetical protein
MVQHLLADAVWETDRVRDDLRDYVVGHPSAGTTCTGPRPRPQPHM